MSFGGIPFGEGTLAGPGYAQAAVFVPPVVGAPDIVIDPFTIEVAGISMKGYQMVDTLSIDVAMGRQGTAQFSLLNLWFVPVLGNSVKITFYNDVIFAGFIDSLSIDSNNMQTFVVYNCECVDNAFLLNKRKIKSTWTGLSVSSIVNGMIGSAIQDGGVAVATMDNDVLVPLAQADGVTVYDFLSGLAASTGTVFSIDNNRKLHFTGATIQTAPTALDEDNTEKCSVKFDREGYINWVTTTVTGTPPTSGTTANEVTLTGVNGDSQLEREAAESGEFYTSGAYIDYASITHPTSNDPVDLVKFANSYNKIRLGVDGSIKRILTVRTRQYGFKVGQSVTVTIDQLGITGDWIIQRVSMREESGRFLVYSMDLSETSFRQRSQQLWLGVVSKGTITIVPPTSIYTNLFTVTATGSGSWTVPTGVTEVQLSVYGAGGGGGGGAKSDWPGYGGLNAANGSAGGGGGLCVGVFSVTPGESLQYTVGVGGSPGPGEFRFEDFTTSFGGNGVSGTESWVKKGGNYLARAYGGEYGIGGACTSRPLYTKTYPAGRGGIASGGQSGTVGGAANGGAGGLGPIYAPGVSGGNGKLLIEW